jgi:hypothetical protein
MKYPKNTDGANDTLTKIRSGSGKDLGVITREDEEDYGCELEGCPGHAIHVEWPDGEETMICSASIAMGKDGWWRIM